MQVTSFRPLRQPESQAPARPAAAPPPRPPEDHYAPPEIESNGLASYGYRQADPLPESDEPPPTQGSQGQLYHYQSVFGSGFGSHLKASCLGALAVALSKTGWAVETAGKKLGLWKAFPAVSDTPMPDSLLGPLPNFKLGRPVVLVPGFHTPSDRFDHVVDKLTADGRNGGRPYYVYEGKFFLDKKCRQPADTPPGPEARVFVQIFETPSTPPGENAPKMDLGLESIKRATGSAKVDVAAYSMGGLSTRVYLDNGGQAVGKFMMVGVPNHGSELGRVSAGLLELDRQGRDVAWLLQRKPLHQFDAAALSWLTPTIDGQPNPIVGDLNSRWDTQKASLEAVATVGSKSRPTLESHFHPSLGDGTVPYRSIAMDGVEAHYLADRHHRNHGHLFCNPEVYTQMADFFGWQAS